MLILISFALVILVCSYKKRGSQSSNSSEEIKVINKNIEINSEPEILVIMAGDHNPTYIAKPIITSSLPYCTCGAESTSSSISTNEQTLTN